MEWHSPKYGPREYYLGWSSFDTLEMWILRNDSKLGMREVRYIESDDKTDISEYLFVLLE